MPRMQPGTTRATTRLALVPLAALVCISSCSRYGHLGAGLYRYLLADSGYSSRLVKGFSLSTSLECTIRRAVLESSFSGRIADRVDHGLFGSGLFSLEFGLRLRLRF